MFMKALFPLAVMVITSGFATAAEYNRSQHMDAGGNSKINKHIASSYRNTKNKKTGYRSGSGNCGNQAVGNVVVEKGAKAPREVITVVRGDVVNVNNGRGCK